MISSGLQGRLGVAERLDDELVERSEIDLVHEIQSDKIISVIPEPRAHLAIGDYEAKYRLIYRR